jgi:hypothetical protein
MRQGMLARCRELPTYMLNWFTMYRKALHVRASGVDLYRYEIAGG